MVLNLIFVIFIFCWTFFFKVFDKTDAVSFLHEKFSPGLGHSKTQWTFKVQNCCLLTFEQACSVLGGGGKRVLYLQMLADCKN